MPNGQRDGNLYFDDFIYDGQITRDHNLYGGLGKLSDGRIASDQSDDKDAWVGWNASLGIILRFFPV